MDAKERRQAYRKAYRAANGERLRARDKALYAADSERRRAKSQAWREANPERRRATNKAWVAANPEKARANRNAQEAKRRARLRNATPPWADHAEIREIYDLAAALDMHVDHIHPLNGKNLCGLHVPWNLQLLPPEDNLRKSNRFPVPWSELSVDIYKTECDNSEMARPFTRTTIRVHPELKKAMEKLARRRSETFSAMLRRYVLEGMERDGVTVELTVTVEESEVVEPAFQPWLATNKGALDL